MFGQDQFDYPGKYVRSFTDHCRETNGIMADTEIRVPGQPYNKASNFNYRLIPVYEVEWLETDKQFVTNRYEVIRIGEEIYIVKGLVKDVQRSISCPTYCGLSINGVYFDNRNDEPFSLVSACMHLQDKYDLLHFYRDNLIASSGTIGDWIDISMLPAQLGVTMPERLQKFLAYKK